VWPPPIEADIQIFDSHNNEFIRLPSGDDSSSRDDKSPIETHLNLSRRAEAELVIPGKRPHTLWFVLLAVLLGETAYLGMHLASEWRQAQATLVSSIAPSTPPLPTQAAVVPADPMDAASTAGRADDARPQALEAGASAMPLRPFAQPATRPSPPAPPVSVEPPGGVSIALPIQVQIFEGGRFVGTNDRERVPLAAGRHQLELVNESLGYRSTEVVNVPSGKTVRLAVPLPSGTLNINAQPWGDVQIDGEPAGQTPLGNVRLPIGPHQIVFHHPQFGTQTRTVIVSAGAAARVAVDLRR
jgi:hypothetical protein